MASALVAYEQDSDDDKDVTLLSEMQPFYKKVLDEAHKSGIESAAMDDLWRLYKMYIEEFKKHKDVTDAKHAMERLEAIHELVSNTTAPDVGGLVGEDYSNLHINEIMAKRELVDMIHASIRIPGNEIPTFFDMDSSLEYIKRVFNPVGIQFSQAHGLMSEPIGPENIVTDSFFEKLMLDDKHLKVFKTLTPYMGKAQDAFEGTGSAVQLGGSVNKAIFELTGRQAQYDGKPLDDADIERLQVNDVEVAKQFIMEAFLGPLRAQGLRADELLIVSKVGLRIKDKYRFKIQIPPNRALDYVMTHD